MPGLKLNRDLVKQRLKLIGERGLSKMNDDQLIEAYCLSGLFNDNEANHGFYEQDITGLEPDLDSRIGTKECVQFLIQWTQENYDTIPKTSYTFPAHRMKELTTGHTRARNWTRRAIKKNGSKTYRMFESRMSLFDHDVQFLVTEENGKLTVDIGNREHFRQYFNKIHYNWGGWD